MSKRKSAVSKKARGPKMAAKAQRAKQAVVKSPKGSHKLRTVTAAFTEPAAERFGALAAAVAKDATAVTGSSWPDFPSASAVVRAYQANLLEMAQANMEFTLEFAQRFAAIKSPDEFTSVIAEFTSRRVAMFQKYSKKMVEIGTKRAA